MIDSPMLAAVLTGAPRFPVLATPKLDGIRCFTADGEARTRSGASLPNPFARAWIEEHCPDGFDGELIVPGLSPARASAALMREDGEPDFEFHVFDYVFDDPDDSYAERIDELSRLDCTARPNRFRAVLPVDIRDQAALDAFERQCLDDGFEGIVLRDPAGPYYPGQTTERQGWMLKLKRFADAEAVITAYDGKALIAEHAGRTVRIGMGFTAADRAELLAMRDTLAGQLVKFSEQLTGAVRSRIFLSLRDPRDLSRSR